jgi:hypothetical protein
LVPEPTGARPEPRPAFTSARLILETLRVWVHNLFAFTAVSALVELPLLALALRADKDAKGGALDLLFVWVMNLIAVGALSHGALRWLNGERAGLGSMLGMLASRLWPIFAVSAVLWLFAVFAAFPGIPLVVPGVLVLLMGFVAVPAAIDKPELGVQGALLLSLRMTKGHRLALLWATLTLFGGYLLACEGLRAMLEWMPTLTRVAKEGIFAAVDAVLTGTIGGCAAVAYHQLSAVYRPEAEPSLF